MRLITIVVMLFLAALYSPLIPTLDAEQVEHIYFLHAESENGIGSYLDLKLANPEPNPAVVSVDVPSIGQYKLGEGWIQNENYNYARDVSGNWTFTMYVYCDDDIIEGRLYAKVFDGFGTRLNSAQNMSQPIGPCSDPNTPVEVIWNDFLDHSQAKSLLQGERFRVEIWLDAISGGTTGAIRNVTAETSVIGSILRGSYLNTTAGNEKGDPYEILQEEEIPCGNSTLYEVVGENGIVGKSISGDFTSLASNDEIFEEVGEDGNPNTLEWIWAIDISPGPGKYTFYLDAVIDLAPANDDNFTFEYSTTGAFTGEEQLMFVVNDSWVGSFTDPPPASYEFPSGSLSGVSTVYIRAQDTNHTDWPQVKDVLKIDRMYIERVEDLLNCSALEHIWRVGNLPLATSHQIYVNAFQLPAGDNDQFRFSYSSISSLGPFVNLFTISNTSDEDYYYQGVVSGPLGFTTLWLRVMDTDRTPASPTMVDQLYVDHIYLNTAGGGTPYKFYLIIDNRSYPSRIKSVEDTTADSIKPTSNVLPLPPYSDMTFEIEYVANDVGSGVHHVELWYILEDGTHVQFPGAFTSSPITFHAPSEGRYRFYTRAVDNALNYEDPPPTFDAVTIVDISPPIILDVSPGNLSTHVSVDATIKIVFSESVDSKSVEDAFQLVEEGGRVWRAADGRTRWNHPINDTFTFSLPSGERLKWATKYTIIVGTGARDLAGHKMMNELESSFETEAEFNPSMLILIIVLGLFLTFLMIYFAFFRRRPKDGERIEEADLSGKWIPDHASREQVDPSAPHHLEPPLLQQTPTHLWETHKPAEEMWREDPAALSACTNCGRFIPTGSAFCPYCGSKRE